MNVEHKYSFISNKSKQIKITQKRMQDSTQSSLRKTIHDTLSPVQ